MKKHIQALLLITVMLIGATPLLAQDLKTIDHDRTTAVEDYAGIFSAEEKEALNAQLAGFFDTVQMAVVTIKTLDGADIAETSTRLFNRWGVGSKSNNGLLLLIAVDDHKMFAATGRAIQGEITDMQASQLQREIAVPEFKRKQYYEGTSKLLAAYVALLQPAATEYKTNAIAATEADDNSGYLWFLLLIPIGIGLVVWYFIDRDNRKKKREYEEEYEKRRAKHEPDDFITMGMPFPQPMMEPLFPYGYPATSKPAISKEKKKDTSSSSSSSSSSSNDDSYSSWPSSNSSYDSSSSSSSSSSDSSSSSFDFSGGSSDGGGGGSDW